jgi:quercetin dioxygenase-like cupin family protein
LTSGWINPETRPDWLEVVAVGRFRVAAGGRFDRHFHDDHELWIITEGKAKISSEGMEHFAQAGDLVMTPAQQIHDIVEVYEELAGFFIETGHPPGGRAGHQYEKDEDRAGHVVPGRPLPAEFPVH